MNNVRISENNLKPICSVRELAEDLLGLSRQHFYNLLKKNVFPMPIYDVRTRRPYYPVDLQKVCLEIRRSKIGYDGRAVLFYRPRQQRSNKPSKATTVERPNAAVNQERLELLEGLRVMGLTRVTTKDVARALKAVYPAGEHKPQGVILRDLYRYLRGQV